MSRNVFQWEDEGQLTFRRTSVGVDLNWVCSSTAGTATGFYAASAMVPWQLNGTLLRLVTHQISEAHNIYLFDRYHSDRLLGLAAPVSAAGIKVLFATIGTNMARPIYVAGMHRIAMYGTNPAAYGWASLEFIDAYRHQRTR